MSTIKLSDHQNHDRLEFNSDGLEMFDISKISSYINAREQDKNFLALYRQTNLPEFQASIDSMTAKIANYPDYCGSSGGLCCSSGDKQEEK